MGNAASTTESDIDAVLDSLQTKSVLITGYMSRMQLSAIHVSPGVPRRHNQPGKKVAAIVSNSILLPNDTIN